MMLTRRTLTACISCFIFFCSPTFASIIPSKLISKSSPHATIPKNETFITLSIDKLVIGSPPQPCCSIRKSPGCEVCVYTCKFLVSDVSKPWISFIDHTFDCSIESIGTQIRIPLLKPLSEPEIDVKLSIFTKKNDQLVGGTATLYVENLEHDPESRILKLNIEDRYDVSFNVSLSCVDGFVGAYCNISCNPPKRGEHHRCTHAGKFCESGYMGEDCNTPICTYGCVRGKCVGPNICSCDFGWQGERCDRCKPTPECKSPYFDSGVKKCRCSNGYNIGPNLPKPDEIGNQLATNNSTYLTLSVLIIILLVICALLLLVVVCLTLRNSKIRLPCMDSSTRKTQPLESGQVSNLSGQRI